MAGGTDIRAGARLFIVGMHIIAIQQRFHTAAHIMSEPQRKFMQARTMRIFLFTAAMLRYDSVM